MTRDYIKLVSIGLLSAALLAPLTHAAEESKAEEQAANASQEDKNATANKSRERKKDSKKDGKKDSKDGGIFIPSEEISEDFAVSFPVDI